MHICARNDQLAALQSLVRLLVVLLLRHHFDSFEPSCSKVFLRGDVTLRDGFGRTVLETAQNYGRSSCVVCRSPVRLGK